MAFAGTLDAAVSGQEKRFFHSTKCTGGVANSKNRCASCAGLKELLRHRSNKVPREYDPSVQYVFTFIFCNISRSYFLLYIVVMFNHRFSLRKIKEVMEQPENPDRVAEG